jgi:hypothetical protein
MRGSIRAAVLTVLLLALPASPAFGRPAGSPRVHLTLPAAAKIVGGGTGAKIQIRGICTPGAEVLEAFVTISQDGFTSQMGTIPLVCDGASHRWRVAVLAGDQPFHPGLATASGYALVMDPGSGETAQDSPFRVITMVA